MLVITSSTQACGGGAPAPGSPRPAITEYEASFERLRQLSRKRPNRQLPAGALGTRSNPVLVEMPVGQRHYLTRLRCADEQQPTFVRLGSDMGEIDPHAVDDYVVYCEGVDATTIVTLDMYHPDAPPQKAVPGFTLLSALPARVAEGCPPRVHDDPDSVAAYVFSEFEVETPPDLLTPLPTPTRGLIPITFVVDTTGRVDASTLEAYRPAPGVLKRLHRWVETLEYEPASHHEGCRVRYRIDGQVAIP